MTKRDKIIPAVAGVVVTVLFLIVLINPLPVIESFINRAEYSIYDLRLRNTNAFASKDIPPITIVDIDEASLFELGRWPWPRNIIAQFVNKLFEAGAIIVAFDVLFSEPERNIAQEIANVIGLPKDVTSREELQALVSKYAHDDLLAQALTKGETVLGFVLRQDNHPSVGVLPKNKVNANIERLLIPSFPNYTSSIAKFQNVATSSGFITTRRDEDGVIRRVPLILRYQDHLMPSLALETYRLYMLAENLNLQTTASNDKEIIEGVDIDGIYTVQTDKHGQVLVPFRGKRGSFPYVPVIDILNDDFNSADINGKIILVGSSALGLADLPATAVESIFPGVEVHANIIAGMIAEKFAYKPIWELGVNFILMLIIGLAISFIFPWRGPIFHVVTASILVGAIILFNLWMWISFNLVLGIVLPLSLVITLMVLNSTYGFLTSKKREKLITGMFSQYVAPGVVKAMSENPGSYSFDGETKDMTVLFADIRSFTTISESLTAEGLKNLLNDFFNPMTKIIFNKQGTIDKYVGDMIMAFWGAPMEDLNHAQNGVEAALKMQKKSKHLSLEFQKKGLPELNIGIGLNSGEMNVGDMGSIYRRSYTVLGDNVNLGSRLEASTKFYGCKILISEFTLSKLSGIICRPIDKVRLKGKLKPVEISEPLCKESEGTDELKQELELFDQALALYYQRNFEQALEDFKNLKHKREDVEIYDIYVNRCKDFIETPPDDDWDGTYVRTEK